MLIEQAADARILMRRALKRAGFYMTSNPKSGEEPLNFPILQPAPNPSMQKIRAENGIH